MVTRKDLIIAVLSIFCLTTALFMTAPTRSQPNTQAIGDYDAWVDVNDDGAINYLDAILLGGSFGALGDPTRNVNVTNWPSIWGEYRTIFWRLNFSTSLGYASSMIWCGGYSRISFSIAPIQASAGNFDLTVRLSGIYWYASLSAPSFLPASFEGAPAGAFNTTVWVQNGSLAYSVPPAFLTTTKEPYLQPAFAFTFGAGVPSDSWITFDLWAYLRNE